jgi:hypothetical protein
VPPEASPPRTTRGILRGTRALRASLVHLAGEEAGILSNILMFVEFSLYHTSGVP